MYQLLKKHDCEQNVLLIILRQSSKNKYNRRLYRTVVKRSPRSRRLLQIQIQILECQILS